MQKTSCSTGVKSEFSLASANHRLPVQAGHGLVTRPYRIAAKPISTSTARTATTARGRQIRRGWTWRSKLRLAAATGYANRLWLSGAAVVIDHTISTRAAPTTQS